jgi:hypothetical protein
VRGELLAHFFSVTQRKRLHNMGSLICSDMWLYTVPALYDRPSGQRAKANFKLCSGVRNALIRFLDHTGRDRKLPSGTSLLLKIATIAPYGPHSKRRKVEMLAYVMGLVKDGIKQICCHEDP